MSFKKSKMLDINWVLHSFSILTFISIFLSNVLAVAVSPRNLNNQLDEQRIESKAIEEVTDESWYFSRFAVTVAPFAEIDVELLELKIQPYVEIRFDRKFKN